MLNLTALKSHPLLLERRILTWLLFFLFIVVSTLSAETTPNSPDDAATIQELKKEVLALSHRIDQLEARQSPAGKLAGIPANEYETSPPPSSH